MDWNTPITIFGVFGLGYVTHNMLGVVTPLNTKINETLGVPINNSTKPVKLDEIRYSTM